MKFSEFRQRVQKLPFFSVSHLSGMGKNRKLLLNQLQQWRKQGKLLRLKRGLYTLGPQECPGGIFGLSKFLIANQLLSPSYVSLEFALSFYGLIPEKAEEVTSVTTRKTSLFKNDFGVFRFQHIKPVCFVGFLKMLDENQHPILIAEREKALVDFFYLGLSSIPKLSKDIFEGFYRLENLEDLKLRRLIQYTRLFQNRKLNSVISLLQEWIRQGKR